MTSNQDAPLGGGLLVLGGLALAYGLRKKNS
ncbi:MAG: LPXTG cell wall anchor domain-containing protein [Bacteroidales bacterium]|nr:LPXTG cell wall anchor domain-containing protein [Bacteroidales bacterium]